MRIVVLHNNDLAELADDPGREARAEVLRVAALVRDALRSLGHAVLCVPVDRTLRSLHHAMADFEPDVAVNLCESLAADSRGELVVPAVLDLYQVPYTGSEALALGLALHKPQAKLLLRASGVDTPRHTVVERVEQLPSVDLPFPLIVKPSREDASAGIDFASVAAHKGDLEAAVARVLRGFRQPAIVEQYVEGREVAVPILGNAPRLPLPATEIRFGAAFAGHPNIVSYRAKWDLASPEYADSVAGLADLDAGLEARCRAAALAAFEALGCRDYGRVDLRVDAGGRPWVIDVNPNCDLHPDAGFARAAAAAGIPWPALTVQLVELALERRHGPPAARASTPALPLRALGPRRDLHARGASLRTRAPRQRAPAE